ncbi:hypothetical protein V6N11_021400 [Hibiscus sabdariffa]|uniref:Uncharacterized protein n=2 Tax=Hibiscus sabdariffa TaxID=183260 RepID=A0ABR2B3M8_9ROSI
MDVVIDAQGDGSDVVLETTVEDCMHCDEGGVERVVDSLQNSGTIPNLPKPSFRDMSTGKGTTLSPSPVLPELDVEITDDDVRLSSVDGMPAITSDRVQDMVDAKLPNAVIVRLLGRNIFTLHIMSKIIYYLFKSSLTSFKP